MKENVTYKPWGCTHTGNLENNKNHKIEKIVLKNIQ